MGLYTKKINEALGLVEKEKNVFYGVYKGYELTLAVNQQFYVHLNFFADGNVKAQAVRVFHTTSNQTMTNVGVSVYGLAATVNGMTANSALKKLTEKLDATIAYLNVNEAKGVGYCPCCGEECDLLKTIRVNDVYVSLDDKCYNEVAKVAAVEEQHYNAQPNNYLKGFLGALLGAGIGAAAWVALYYMGFLSALTAVLAVFLGIILFLLPVKPYAPIMEAVSTMANLTTPLAMIILGAYLAKCDLIHIFTNKKVYIVSFLRLVGLPLLALLLLTILPIENETIKMVMLIVSSAPTAALLPIFCQMYDHDIVYGTEIVCFTTLASILTLPLLILLSSYIW